MIEDQFEAVIQENVKPEAFDVLGFVVFLLITTIAVWGLRNSEQCKSVPPWMFLLLLIIGIGGLIVDATLVYVFLLK